MEVSTLVDLIDNVVSLSDNRLSVDWSSVNLDLYRLCTRLIQLLSKLLAANVDGNLEGDNSCFEVALGWEKETLLVKLLNNIEEVLT